MSASSMLVHFMLKYKGREGFI